MSHEHWASAQKCVHSISATRLCVIRKNIAKKIAESFHRRLQFHQFSHFELHYYATPAEKMYYLVNLRGEGVIHPPNHRTDHLLLHLLHVLLPDVPRNFCSMLRRSLFDRPREPLRFERHVPP